MRDNPGELNPADDVHRCSKKNSPSILTCLGKRTKESCDRGSDVGIKPYFIISMDSDRRIEQTIFNFKM